MSRKRRRDTPEENQTILRFAEFLLEWQARRWMRGLPGTG